MGKWGGGRRASSVALRVWEEAETVASTLSLPGQTRGRGQVGHQLGLQGWCLKASCALREG